MLTWNWGKMVGTTVSTRTDGTKFYTSLYRGNADIVDIFNDEQYENYSLTCFVIDLAHAKRMADSEPYKGIKVYLLRGEFPSQTELKKVAWELLILGANVEFI